VFVGFHAYINEMHGSRSKVPSKKSGPYLYDVKFLALLGAPYIYDISRLRVKYLRKKVPFWLFISNIIKPLKMKIIIN
jgi:hypothetical protein